MRGSFFAASAFLRLQPKQRRVSAKEIRNGSIAAALRQTRFSGTACKQKGLVQANAGQNTQAFCANAAYSGFRQCGISWLCENAAPVGSESLFGPCPQSADGKLPARRAGKAPLFQPGRTPPQRRPAALFQSAAARRAHGLSAGFR